MMIPCSARKASGLAGCRGILGASDPVTVGEVLQLSCLRPNPLHLLQRPSHPQGPVRDQPWAFNPRVELQTVQYSHSVFALYWVPAKCCCCSCCSGRYRTASRRHLLTEDCGLPARRPDEALSSDPLAPLRGRPRSAWVLQSCWTAPTQTIPCLHRRTLTTVQGANAPLPSFRQPQRFGIPIAHPLS